MQLGKPVEKLGLAPASTLFVPLALETGLRVRAHLTRPRELEALASGPRPGPDEPYLAVLEQKLRQRRAAPGSGASSSPPRWQVINTAVPGYNTAMEVELRKAVGSGYEPQIVVLGFVVNDLGPLLVQLVEEGGYGSYLASPFALSRTDAHPSALAHRIVAEELLAHLTDRQLLTARSAPGPP